MSYKLKRHMKPEQLSPDIFRAADTNDVEELYRALEDGQLLTDQRSDLGMMSPVHVAAAKHSNDFLREAAGHESFDPYLLDGNGYQAMDHAMAFNNSEGHAILMEVHKADTLEYIRQVRSGEQPVLD